MLRRRKKIKYETLTPTKINNYNQFLKNLDKYQHQQKYQQKYNHDSKNTYGKDCQDCENENTNTNENVKDVIDSIIQRCSKQYLYGNLSDKHFHGLNKNDNIDYISHIKNPNEYTDDSNFYYLFTPFPTPSTSLNNKMELNESNEIKNTTDDILRSIKQYNLQKQTIEMKHVNIDVEIQNINDILKLIEEHKLDRTIKYNINMKALHNIKEPLIELNNMIGMNQLKTSIVDQILYFVQNLHQNNKTHADTSTYNGDFIHSVVYGPPGTGKTEVAKLMGKIYSNLGILQKGTFKKVTRSDLVAGYLGQTAIKTKDVIKECLGGVLFIDEAYALGNDEKRDSFSKECIDTLCEALSDHKHELMVIIAGYENELNDCFFAYNQGLESRFTWRFKTDEYNGTDLYHIFLKKVKDIGWSVYNETDSKTKSINDFWFKEKKSSFRYYGRDIETLLSKTKIAHSRRVFCKPENEKRVLILDDLNKGYEMFMQNDNNKKQKEKMNEIITSMYV